MIFIIIINYLWAATKTTSIKMRQIGEFQAIFENQKRLEFFFDKFYELDISSTSLEFKQLIKLKYRFSTTKRRLLNGYRRLLQNKHSIVFVASNLSGSVKIFRFNKNK